MIAILDLNIEHLTNLNLKLPGLNDLSLQVLPIKTNLPILLHDHPHSQHQFLR